MRSHGTELATYCLFASEFKAGAIHHDESTVAESSSLRDELLVGSSCHTGRCHSSHSCDLWNRLLAVTSFDQFWPVLTGFDQFHMLSLSGWYDLIWSQIYWSNTKATLYVISTSCMGLAMRLNIFNVCLLPTNKLIPAMLTCWLVRAVVHLEPSIDGSTHVDETFPENQKIKVAGVDAFQHVCNSMFLDEILMWNGEFGEKNELRNELWIVF